MELPYIYDLMSRRRKGPVAAAARCLLWAAQAPYAAATALRNRRYDRVPAKAQHATVPVVSVGNITTGGTGKTPMVEFLAKWFRHRSVRVCIVSRGYGAEEGARNDEALELELRLPDVPHLQNPDRIAAAATAVEELATELIIMDDGFQHRRLHRDLDLVLLDALEPFGFGHVLPRGLLRESLRGLRRADALILSRADSVSSERRHEIQQTAKAWAGDKPWIEVAHRPHGWINDESELPLEAFARQKIAAFCGIGNPDGFKHSLEQCGCELVGFRAFADHHSYDQDDVSSLETWADSLDIQALVCTEKDLVKLQIGRLGPTPLWALRICLDVRSGREALESLLQPLVEQHQNE